MLYSLCKRFPAVDFVAQSFTLLFQSTVSPSHAINLDAIMSICDHVKQTRGATAKVKLFFVVPSQREFDDNWRKTQSFVETLQVMENK